jgi:hypothetical protein
MLLSVIQVETNMNKKLRINWDLLHDGENYEANTILEVDEKEIDDLKSIIDLGCLTILESSEESGE